MTGIRRPLTLAAALIVTMAAAATAQTVYVAKTPPGTSVELGVNATNVGTATSDANGVATIPLDTLAAPTSKSGKTELVVHVFVDVCEKARRVWLTEIGWQTPDVAAGCARREMFGLFALQKLTSLVVDAAEQNQAVWIRQGVPPSSWLDPNAQPEVAAGPSWDLATGLVLWGGAGLGSYSTSALIACGSAADVCTASSKVLSFRGGADFWLNRFMAITGSYLKPLTMEATGSGSSYRFTTTFAPNIATIGGKGAFALKRGRIYGEGGGTYQRSNFQTTESVNPLVVTTASGQEIVSPGGTQVFNLQTAGWGWYFGAGFEIWVKRRWGVFGEFGRAEIRGTPRAGGEGSLNELVTYYTGGVRLALTR
jgi:hypothetical protein